LWREVFELSRFFINTLSRWGLDAVNKSNQIHSSFHPMIQVPLTYNSCNSFNTIKANSFIETIRFDLREKSDFGSCRQGRRHYGSGVKSFAPDNTGTTRAIRKVTYPRQHWHHSCHSISSSSANGARIVNAKRIFLNLRYEVLIALMMEAVTTSAALMMEAVTTSKTTARRNFPEDSHLKSLQLMQFR
jgi:hypothetical protein